MANWWKWFALAATAWGALYSMASAAPIAAGSELSTAGSDSFTASSTAFDITFTNPANLEGTSGSFATAFGAVPPAINNVVTYIATLTDTSTNFQLYSATVGTVTSTLTAGTISSFSFIGGAIPSLDVNGTGTLNLTGFDPTPGQFTLTTQGGNTNVSFSETAVATSGVPEPGSLVLLGSMLIGCWGMSWRYRGR